MKKILYSIAILALMVSCNSNSSKLKELQAQNDSLVIANTQSQEEFDELLSTLNSVEDGFAKIKEQENYLVVQAQSKNDFNKSTKERIADDLQLISETLQKNREELQKLRNMYESSQNKSAQLKKRIDMLTNELESKSAQILALQEELAKKDAQISNLTQSLTEFAGTIDQLSLQTQQQKKQLAQQDAELNTGYFVCGTKNELKEQKILTKSGAFSKSKVLEDDFNKEYFTRVDIRKVQEIPREAPKAKILTNMPEGSYQFVRGDNKNLTLVITITRNFGAFLVIW